jgi:hypothetical protein
MGRGWEVHDASDELARLSLYGGQGIASKKQVVQRRSRIVVNGNKALYLQTQRMQRYGRSYPMMLTALPSRSLRLPHRAPRAFANQQLTSCFASNSGLLVPAPVGRPGAEAFQLFTSYIRHTHFARRCCHPPPASKNRAFTRWLNVLMRCIQWYVP